MLLGLNCVSSDYCRSFGKWHDEGQTHRFKRAHAQGTVWVCLYTQSQLAWENKCFLSSHQHDFLIASCLSALSALYLPVLCSRSDSWFALQPLFARLSDVLQFHWLWSNSQPNPKMLNPVGCPSKWPTPLAHINVNIDPELHEILTMTHLLLRVSKIM